MNELSLGVKRSETLLPASVSHLQMVFPHQILPPPVDSDFLTDGTAASGSDLPLCLAQHFTRVLHVKSPQEIIVEWRQGVLCLVGRLRKASWRKWHLRKTMKDGK